MRSPTQPQLPARLRALLSTTALLGAALLYRFPPTQYPFYPRCPIHQFTGFECPGCGLTRALAALIHGQFIQAIHLNALILILIPASIYLLSRRTLPKTLPKPAWITFAALIAAFTVARNFYTGW